MKHLSIIFALLAINCGFGSQVVQELTEADLKKMERAHTLADEIRGKLKNKLQKAIKEKGEAKSVPECKVTVQDLTKLPKTESWHVGRTSDRLRNPSNAPQAWIVPYLEKYRAQPKAEHQKSVMVKLGEKHFGYLEPIYVEGMCLRCHGKGVSPEVRAELKEFYPNDAAIDFNEGDFRGFIWVETR